MAGPASEVLSGMITPALLISASGTLVLSTSNRLSRVVDRVRVLTAEAERSHGPESPATNARRALLISRQLEHLGACPGNPGVAFRAPRGRLPGDATIGDTGHHRGASTPQTAPRRPEPPGRTGVAGKLVVAATWQESQLQHASLRLDLAAQAPCVRPRDFPDSLLSGATSSETDRRQRRQQALIARQ